MNWYRVCAHKLVGAVRQGIGGLPALALLICGASAARVGAQNVPGSTKALVFDGVSIVDVEHGKTLPAQRVVVTGNRITEAGPAAQVNIPQGAQVIDAKGKYLIPGLWDMHAHPRRAASVFYPLFIANGVTGFRDAWSENSLDTLRQWRREILAGTRVGPPLQLLAGPALDEQNPCTRDNSGHICVADAADARHVVDSLKAAGSDYIKTYQLGREVYLAIASEARKVGLPFGGHLPGPSAKEASDSGAAFIDHIESTGGLDTLCLETAATLDRCKPIAAQFRRTNTWWVPTWIRPPYGAYGEDQRSHPVLEQFAKDVQAYWGGSVVNPYASNHAYGPTNPSPAQASRAKDSLGFMNIVRHADLPTVAGTDAGAPVLGSVPPGFSLHTEVELYVAEGMTPLEALQTSTLNAAKVLHLTDSLGTVARGKLADLVLLDADPLVDIGNITLIRAVIANGRYFDRAALDQLLQQARTEAKNNSLL